MVLGTKPEYFNAVWVKNEWSRFLALVKDSNGKKTLIPAYKDMDPYDLPEEFSHLQAQDMSKLGFMQDLIRGIKKLAGAQEQKPAVVVKETVSAGVANPDALLRRAFMFLEDGDWKSADEYCEKVLDQDPENAQAYLGKLMAEKEVKTREGLKELPEPFDDSKNYQKAIRFGDKKLVAELKGNIAQINDRNVRNAYKKAKNMLSTVSSKNINEILETLQEVIVFFDSISGYKDADVLAQKCSKKLKEAKKEQLYQSAVSSMNNTTDLNVLEAAQAFLQSANLFHQIAEYKDSDILAAECMDKRNEAIYYAAYHAIKNAPINGTTSNVFDMAIDLLKQIPNYKDSDALLNECNRKKKIYAVLGWILQNKGATIIIFLCALIVIYLMAMIGMMIWN